MLIVVAVLGIGATAHSITVAAGLHDPPSVASSATPQPSDLSPAVHPSTSPEPSPSPSAPPPPPSFDKAALSIDDPNSLWVVANKLRPLSPHTFAPADLVTARVPYEANATLRAEAAAALEQMFAAAIAEGAGQLMVQNAYRSYETQVGLHNRLVNQLGKERARAQSAVPGHSEHQTGLSADIMSSPQHCSIAACFGETVAGRWLADNAPRFGFVLRYPAEKTPITGYVYEPWHFRYVGTALAAEMKLVGAATLEEFFGLPAAPDYPPGS